MADRQFYTLQEFVSLLKEYNMLAEYDLQGKNTKQVDRLTYDSHAVGQNTLFICKGSTFKQDYLEEALSGGAICYVSEKKYDVEASVPYILVRDIRRVMPLLANAFFNNPWEDIHVIGVGGTKGKSTTVYYITSIINTYMQAAGGKESAVISSIDTYDGKTRFESHITTPEAVELQQHIRNAVDSDIDYLAMEVSSQALKYHRVDGMRFDIGIFLNISEDHISAIEHADFEDYLSSKMKMFEKTDIAIVNLDTDCNKRVMHEALAAHTVITYSCTDPQADYYAYDMVKANGMITFRVTCAAFDQEFVLTMPGMFNVENALAAIAAAVALNIPREYIYTGLKEAKSKGRMEAFESKDGDIVAIVDYAHNKLSYEKVFAAMEKEYPGYLVKTIFGCAGEKAQNRRKDLGTLAGRHSDEVFIVAEDPGEEPVEKISTEIAQYVKAQNCPFRMIEDRGEAIKAAIEGSHGKTLILVLGKGCETRQKYHKGYVPCSSDADYVLQYLKEYDAHSRKEKR